MKFLYHIVAPSVPRYVEARAVSSTSINVTWSEPSMLNGIVHHYNVRYYRTDIGRSDLSVISISGLYAALQNLSIYTRYTIVVEGVTVAVGNGSDPIIIRTQEDG